MLFGPSSSVHQYAVEPDLGNNVQQYFFVRAASRGLSLYGRACQHPCHPGRDVNQQMVMVNVNLYSATVTMCLINALSMLVAREKPGFQALFKGLIVLLCAEVVRQGVPDHGAKDNVGRPLATNSVSGH